MPFNQSMTIPLELKLTATADGPRLTWTPVKELASLRTGSHSTGSFTVKPGDANPLAQVSGELLEVHTEFEPGAMSVVSLDIRGVAVVYDAAKQELTVNGHRAPAPLRGGKQTLTVYVDRASLEVFAGDGLTYVPMPVQPAATNLTLQVSVTGHPVKFSLLEAHKLRSIWP
jgi:sucrose-6-phosphate hydrolase SacC (GH32 family)